ncbi:MAG: DUF2842 domain-containing protein [Mangrovicoccus sp.]|nr:DUF2842 domain-containing protein [Mangrovicoccus sp.]
MALSYTARRRWSLVILLLWVPLYIVACVTVMGWLGRPPFLVELGVYLSLGLLWALPFRGIFRGIGRADPEAGPPAPRAGTGGGDGQAG